MELFTPTKFGFCQVCECRVVINTQIAWNILQRAKGKLLMATGLLTVAWAPEHSFLQKMFNCSLLSRTFPSACKRNYCFPPLVQSEEVNSPSFLWQAETVNDWDTTVDRVYCPNYNPVPNQPSLFRLPSWHFGDFLTYFLVHKDSSLIFKNLMCFFL